MKVMLTVVQQLPQPTTTKGRFQQKMVRTGAGTMAHVPVRCQYDLKCQPILARAVNPTVLHILSPIYRQNLTRFQSIN